jgi:hypothetical protein
MGFLVAYEGSLSFNHGTTSEGLATAITSSSVNLVWQT